MTKPLLPLEEKLLKAYIKAMHREIREPWRVDDIRYGALTDTYVIVIIDAKDIKYFIQL